MRARYRKARQAFKDTPCQKCSRKPVWIVLGMERLAGVPAHRLCTRCLIATSKRQQVVPGKLGVLKVIALSPRVEDVLVRILKPS